MGHHHVPEQRRGQLTWFYPDGSYVAKEYREQSPEHTRPRPWGGASSSIRPGPQSRRKKNSRLPNKSGNAQRRPGAPGPEAQKESPIGASVRRYVCGKQREQIGLTW